jgi:septum formation protein
VSDSSLVLASSSPRRQQLLSLMGLPFTTANTNLDEKVIADELPQNYVNRLACGKAVAVWNRLASAGGDSGKVVILGADTCVVANGEILGKPHDFADARRILHLLANRWHQVYTAVCVVTGSTKSKSIIDQVSLVVTSRVKFRELADSEIEWYWQSGEPQDKAGAYAVQGIGGIFIERIEGSYSAIVGLPLCETAELLSRAGFTVGSRKYE